MSDEEKTGQSPPEPEKPKVEWSYKTEFGINGRMREIVNMTIKTAEAEIERYRRKIEKLTYGS